MSNTWFRFYSEALNDPKVQSLDGDTFKVWVNLLCVTSQCDGHINFDDVSFYLRMSDKDALSYCVKLCDLGLLLPHDNGWSPNGWEKRQYKTDTSAERTKRYRERKINKQCDDVVTSHVTAPDTDTEQNISSEDKSSSDNARPPKKSTRSSAAFDLFWEAWPLKENKQTAMKAFLKVEKEIPHDSIARTVELYAEHCRVTDRPFCHAATWLNQRRWENDYAKLIAEAGRSAAGSAVAHRKAQGGAEIFSARDTRDPATRARDEGERIIAERRARWAAEDAAKARQAGAGAADVPAVPDVCQPADLRGQGADDGIQGSNVSGGAGGLFARGNPGGVHPVREVVAEPADAFGHRADYRPVLCPAVQGHLHPD